jgi:hypothetical protein
MKFNFFCMIGLHAWKCQSPRFLIDRSIDLWEWLDVCLRCGKSSVNHVGYTPNFWRNTDFETREGIEWNRNRSIRWFFDSK